jgi:hypothetical protein
MVGGRKGGVMGMLSDRMPGASWDCSAVCRPQRSAAHCESCTCRRAECRCWAKCRRKLYCMVCIVLYCIVCIVCMVYVSSAPLHPQLARPHTTHPPAPPITCSMTDFSYGHRNSNMVRMRSTDSLIFLIRKIWTIQLHEEFLGGL